MCPTQITPSNKKPIAFALFCIIVVVLTFYTLRKIERFHLFGSSRETLEFGDRQDIDFQIQKSLDGIQNLVPSNKYLIYVCNGKLCGGLGNRQNGFIGAYLISLLTNRTFGIVHTSPCPLSNFLLPNRIQWNLDLQRLRGHSTRLHKTVDKNKFLRNVSNTDFKSFYAEDVVFLKSNLDLVNEIRRNGDTAKVLPWLLSTETSDVYRILLMRMFQYSQEINDTVSAFFSMKVKTRKLVCAHVRLGKNPTIPGDTLKRLHMGDLKQLWQFISLYNDTDQYKIFVASDAQSVIEYSKFSFPKQFVGLPGVITHVDRSKSGDLCSGFRKAVMDQLILSKCDVLILTKSGFGRMSAYMRGSSSNLFCYSKKQVTACVPDLVKF